MGSGGELPGREVGVTEPAGIRGGADEPAEVQEESPGQKQPVAERIQPRKGDVPSADEERNGEVDKSGGQWHDGQKDHRRPVHGK